MCNILNIKLIYRNIKEIKRSNYHKNGLRDIYENITRNIRYDMYKKTSGLFNNLYETFIMLGHNKDDCFENIITNISLKMKYDNLKGMDCISIVDNIIFWRPLLEISKENIIKLAISSNIPYLVDSTPKWSSRGIIRDEIRPALLNINKDIVNSYFHLENLLSNNNKLIDKYIIPEFLSKFKYEDNKNILIAEFELEEIFNDISIWRKLFNNEPLKSYISYKITSKSLDEFIKFIDRFNKNINNIEINKVNKCLLNKKIYINIVKKNNYIKIFLNNR